MVQNMFSRINKMSKTIWQCWENNAANAPHSDAIIHWNPGRESYRWTFGPLLERAKMFSVILKGMGIKKDEVCAIIIRHHPDFYPLYMGITALGAIPAVLAYPNPRLHPDKFRQGIEGMSQRSGLDWILTEVALQSVLRPLIENHETTIRGILLPFEQDLDAVDISSFEPPTDIKATDPMLLQHSSGTTGLQKPVLISHLALMEHAVSYGEALAKSTSDKVVSWLPLYHDMGLIASFHLPLLWGIPSIQISPFDWVLAPELLIEATSREKATLTWLPNFAFNLMAGKIHEEDIEGFRLDSLRMVINASEPIRKNSHELFVERFSKYGLNPTAISTLYGMAETCMAITQTFTGSELAEVKADRKALSQGLFKPSADDSGARICVSAGRLIRGCEVKIVDDNRQQLPPGHVGEIAIRSVSLFDGYRNYPEKTAAVMHEGWYFSGDIGFEDKGEYYIIGRMKDTIISAGKNVYPEDIEDIVSLVDGVIPGRVIAFGEDDENMGTDLIGIVAETTVEGEAEKEKIKMEIMKAGMSIDITVSHIYLVPPRWLIKSSAGKPGRNTNKERILQEEENKKWRVI